MKADRRFVLGLGFGATTVAAAGGGLAYALGREAPLPGGALAGADMARGHRLRTGGFPAPDRFEEVDLVIAGGGVAGLSAGWRLTDAGFDRFRLLELEDQVGGNARSGRNPVSAYPLGAHYLPVANREAKALRHLLRQLGMITGDSEGIPVYDPEQLCADMQERLFWQGRWQEGLIPRTGITARDRRDLAAFEAAMSAFSKRIGADGKPAFALPMAYSSRDADLTALDTMSFAAWLDRQGWHSPVLRAHVRYAMRDDYGTEPREVSAWAGMHYFAARRGWAANGAGDNELAWPEGNARLTQRLAGFFPQRIAPGHIVHRVAREGEHILVDSFDVAAKSTTRTRARAAILALPHFIAARICDGIEGPAGFSYAPWLVANITVDRLPAGRGVPLAWDNVSSTSESLGYVVATHQGPDAITSATVLTWYLPLSDMPPAQARQLLVQRSADEWKRIVRDDLLGMHPELDGAIQSIELWRWGHAMIRPTPGFLWRGDTVEPGPPLFLAHSDLSGLSLFEEAHYRGVHAAERAMAMLGHAHESLL
ncbi:twin-arginine translocation pathway signal protein [Sphingomonas gei]|uniref:Twin-arginine translocation pathway signal protein n=1 Tax=Sphingomonas gei TaxID=1395960 RepID=A0A4S1XBQ4_9SPHN|nr:FAD-dependent oxidoreductase [Sphingomonas gei]TGX53521.1 twin-arginine translocation pathway signal protein [Sphingomonas gei]